MKLNYKKATAEDLNETDRTPEESLREIGDRVQCMFMKVDGSYELPSDHPMLFDVLKMIISARRKI